MEKITCKTCGILYDEAFKSLHYSSIEHKKVLKGSSNNKIRCSCGELCKVNYFQQHLKTKKHLDVK